MAGCRRGHGRDSVVWAGVVGRCGLPAQWAGLVATWRDRCRQHRRGAQGRHSKHLISSINGTAPPAHLVTPKTDPKILFP